jgi:hypothetical protein
MDSWVIAIIVVVVILVADRCLRGFKEGEGEAGRGAPRESRA